MLEVVFGITSSAHLVGFCATVLIGFACWRLHLLERGPAPLIGSIAAALSVFLYCLFWLPYLLQWLPGLASNLSWFYRSGLWEALIWLTFAADLVLILSLARSFYLLDKQQSGPSGVSSPPA
ncbi:MAG: hypothetical protein AAGI48_12170 [Verrucomicrobiota bacterium]